MKPNLFECAASELSQDGFLTWLMNWADPKHKSSKLELWQCAQSFVKYLIAKQVELPQDFEIKSVKIKRQWHYLDILVRINENIFIVIEDKVWSEQHSGQLERYKKEVEEHYQILIERLVCIFLKTGDKADFYLEDVRKNGYAVITRRDLLAFFAAHNVQNDIYADFAEHLQRMENSALSYQTLPIAQWHWGSWSGFFLLLEERIGKSPWGPVHSVARHYLAYAFAYRKCANYDVYLQIEHDTGDLQFRISGKGKGRLLKSFLTEWHNAILHNAQSNGKNEIQHPKRFAAAGKTAAAAVVARRDWLGAGISKVEIEAVVNRLKEYEHFLEVCIMSCKK